jgi:site-specific DNA recombinase
MSQEQGYKAVIYVRVSTEEQENRCRKYCEQGDLSVVKVFIDAGASARSSDRPEFQNMLAFCRVHRNDVRFVVVQDLSRFARNHRDQAEAIYDLGRSGVKLRSTYESNIDETAGGKLAANIFGAFNQFFSDSHSEKQRDRKRLAVAGGRVPWRAPIGYTNINAKDGPNIKPDERYAPLVRRAFELASTGLRKKTEILAVLSKEGFNTPNDRPLAGQSLDHLLQNPLYAGWVTLPSEPNVQPVRGLHEPLVTQQTFDRVQAVLHGKKPPMAPRRKTNPDFPLRRLVSCEACGTPLTGAYCKGRGGRYPRYWCRQEGCRKVSAPKANLESEFQMFLGRLRPDQKKVADFTKIATRVWDAKQGNSERELKSLRSQLEEEKKRKSKLLSLRTEGEISREEFEEANVTFREKICAIEEKIQAVDSTRATSASFVRFAELQLTDMAHVWRIASPEQRERVQNLLFQDGLDYSPKTGFLNRSESSLFNALETVDFNKVSLVEAVGVEPTSETTFNREHSCFSTFIFVSSVALRTGEDATPTSLIDLVRPAQTEQGRPAYCATIGTGP